MARSGPAPERPRAGRRATVRALASDLLLDGVNHVAVLTHDTERLSRFYTEIFDAPPARAIEQQPGFKLSIIDIGHGRELNVFEIEGNAEVDRQTPMFGRGRLDHVGLQAASMEAFEEIRRRLMACRRQMASSPTSALSSRCSSPTLTAWRARSSSRTPTPPQASRTLPVHVRSGSADG